MTTQSVSELIEAVERGEAPKFLVFWGHQAAKPDAIDKSCFSQWWPSPFRIDGVNYTTAEHWMMASKAAMFSDEHAYEKILAARTPEEAKTIGRTVKEFDERLWIAERFGVVVRGSEAKFEQNPVLCDYLIGTKTRILVEASPVDSVWGIGLDAKDPRAQEPQQWKGLNLLGFALMVARGNLIRSGEEKVRAAES
jgi:ribA/ribD-fused uncharacterized protein